MLKKIILTFLLLFSFSSFANDTNNPYSRTKIAADKIFSSIMKQKEQIKTNPSIVKDILVRDLLPNIHVKYAAALSLGEYYKTLQKKDRDTFFDTFEKYLLNTFATFFAIYNGQDYVVENSKDLKNKNQVSVTVLLKDKSMPNPINFTYQWRKNTNTGEWQTYDLIVEGSSMIASLKDSWSGILKTKGINGLMTHLKDKNNVKF